jgi:sugar lactone lactonase YvrE
MRVDCVCDAKAILGEGPYWDVIDQRLYWVDIKGKLIHRFDPETGRDETWPTPEVIGSLAVRAKGSLIVACDRGSIFTISLTARPLPLRCRLLIPVTTGLMTARSTAKDGFGRAAWMIWKKSRRVAFFA